MQAAVEPIPLFFLIAGVVTLIGAIAFVQRRDVQQPTESRSPTSVVLRSRHFVGALIIGIATFEVALASLRLLYPQAELKLDSGSFADVVKGAFWPIAFVVFLAMFNEPLGTFLKTIKRARFKVLDNEVELGEAEAVDKVTDALRKADATTKPKTATASPPLDEMNVGDIARIAVRGLRLAGPTEPARVLWVDDQPNNNVVLRNAFERVGVLIDLGLDTDEGLAQLSKHRYAAVISDMGRPPDSRAGYTLLSKMRARGDRTPFIIYAGSDSAAHRAEAIEAGAIASTNRASEVFQLVTTLVLQQALAQGR